MKRFILVFLTMILMTVSGLSSTVNPDYCWFVKSLRQRAETYHCSANNVPPSDPGFSQQLVAFTNDPQAMKAICDTYSDATARKACLHIISESFSGSAHALANIITTHDKNACRAGLVSGDEAQIQYFTNNYVAKCFA